MHPLRIALIIAGLLAAGAFYPNHSYNYFVLLKWVIFSTAIWAAVVEADKKQTFIVVTMVIIAIIHNPIFRFRFERESWLIINGVSIILFIYASKIVKIWHIITFALVLVSCYFVKLHFEETKRKENAAANEALRWKQKMSNMRELAVQGNPEDQYRFASYLGTNDSIDWLSKAANQGHVAARLSLIDIYLDNGTIEQSAFAAQWLSELSEQNNHEAQFELSKLYRTGKIVKKDERKAFEFLRLSVDNGDRFNKSHAQELLGEFYEKGIGTNINLALSHMWYSASITGIINPGKNNLSGIYPGNSARSKIELIEKSMTQNELNEARRLYNDWFKNKSQFALPEIDFNVPPYTR